MATKEQLAIFPIFEECKTYTLDPFWRDKFSEFASNRFPPGMRYDAIHHNLVLKIDGKKSEVAALSEDEPSETFQTMMKILKEKYDMKSSRDLKVQKKAIEEAIKKREVDLDCEFKNIKPRHLKDQLIMDYLAGLKQHHELTNIEFKHLISVVQLGFQFRSLSPSNVDYSNGVVSKITGLTFDEKKRIFTTPSPGPISKPEKSTNIDRFYSSVKKFIQDDKNRVKKFNTAT